VIGAEQPAPRPRRVDGPPAASANLLNRKDVASRGGDDLRGHDPVEGHSSSLAVGSANNCVRCRDFDQLADNVVVWRLG
jgi:hypothetical protein